MRTARHEVAVRASVRRARAGGARATASACTCSANGSTAATCRRPSEGRPRAHARGESTVSLDFSGNGASGGEWVFAGYAREADDLRAVAEWASAECDMEV